MDLDTDTDTDSQDQRVNLGSKHLKHFYEPYFKRLFSSTGFIKNMNQRCSGPNDSTSYVLLCEAIKRNDNVNAQALVRHYCKANMGCPDPGKDIPLHLAIMAGNVEIVELLLSKGARASVSFQDQKEPLHLVCDKSSSYIPDEGSRVAMCKLLLRHGANVDAVEKARRDTPLILAVRSKFLGLAKFLLESGSQRHYANKYSESALHAAFSENAGNDMVELLYDEGFDLQQQDKNDCTVFSYAVRNLMNAGFGSFCNLNEPVRAILFLLKRGVSVNTQLDKRGNRILHMICQNHAAQTIKIFLEHGAEVNARNIDGKTALHFCAESQSVDLVKLLLEYGADPRALTNSGQSCLHFAAANKHPEVLESLLGRGLDVDAKDKDGNFTPLFNAVWSNRHENARLLLDWRANVNERIINSQIVLHVAVDQKHASCVELLLERGSDVNLLDDYGNSPLTISLYQIAESSGSADWWDGGDSEASPPTETVQRILTKHTARMAFLGQPLSEQSLRIMNNPHFKDLYGACLRELGLMKASKLLGDVSFLDVLANERDGKLLLSYMRNDGFVAALGASRYKECFPAYGENLERNLEANAEKFELLKASAESLVKIVQNVDKSWSDIHLPSLIVDHVLGYLNLSDLRNLASVYT